MLYCDWSYSSVFLIYLICHSFHFEDLIFNYLDFQFITFVPEKYLHNSKESIRKKNKINLGKKEKRKKK